MVGWGSSPSLSMQVPLRLPRESPCLSQLLSPALSRKPHFKMLTGSSVCLIPKHGAAESLMPPGLGLKTCVSWNLWSFDTPRPGRQGRVFVSATSRTPTRRGGWAGSPAHATALSGRTLVGLDAGVLIPGTREDRTGKGHHWAAPGPACCQAALTCQFPRGLEKTSRRRCDTWATNSRGPYSHGSLQRHVQGSCQQAEGQGALDPVEFIPNGDHLWGLQPWFPCGLMA